MLSPDCELIRAGFPAQPVAAFTAIGFVLAGIWTIWRHRSIGPAVFAATLVGVGATSFALHGWPQDGRTESVAVIAMLGWLALWAATPTRASTLWGWTAGVAAVGLIVALAPVVRHGLTTAAIAAVVIVLARTGLWRDPRVLTAIAVFVAAVPVYALSRTGGPWCDPASLLQGHGVWHLMAATSLGVIGETVGATERGTPPCP